ncbi:Ankyrin-3 [Phytophthora citrophthora]|uniref:Ankyrin-3 n=1 Tax=Phytophthora citrophthora TaxID=4793 RepID=A0AAD9GIK1_9STRA|nr:Ankyrin-3 [Phytophthora citrophthora]
METPNASPTQQEAEASSRENQKFGSSLHNAALEGDIALVEEALKAGASPDTGDKWKLTPIMALFVRHGLQETRCIFQERTPVRRLLVMDCREEDAKRTATTVAILNLFLQHGANPNVRSDRGKTALHYAISDGLCEAARVLLDAGASIDAQDEDGRTPLYCAVQERSLLVIHLLLNNRASIDLEDNSGVSPLSLGIQNEHLDVMQLFLNHHALVATRERLDFAGEVLLEAVDAKSVDVVRFLLENADVTLDYQNEAGETAMHHAIVQHSTQMMRTIWTLDSTGQCLRKATAKGENCFHFAARLGTTLELEVLLEFRDQITGDPNQDLLNSIDSFGSTPLFAAATSRYRVPDRQAKMQLLLANGAVLLRNEALPGGLPLRSSSAASGFIVCFQVWKCLVLWVAECREENEALVRDFCTKWITGVHVKAKLMTVLNLAVCAGFAVDVVPLLLLLPQTEGAIPVFLRSLEAFNDCSNGLQFDCLTRELRASWI